MSEVPGSGSTNLAFPDSPIDNSVRARSVAPLSLVHGLEMAGRGNGNRERRQIVRYQSVDSVSVRIQGNGASEARPGSVITTVLALTNAGAEARHVIASVSVPDDWLVVRAPSTIRLDAAQTSIHLVTVKIPSDARAGAFTMTFRFDDATDDRFLSSAETTVTLAAVRNLSLTVLSQPGLVAVGDEYRVVMLLTNLGNVRSRVRLRLTGSSSGLASLDTETLEIPAGESVELVVRARADGEIWRPMDRRFGVVAGVIGHPDVRAVASSVVRVVPVGSAEPKPSPMDVVVTAGMVGDEHRSAATYRIEASGDLYGGRMDADLRFPDRRGFSRFGLRDEYQASFESDALSVWLGDHAFNVSPLTAAGDYAFGIGGRFRASDVELDAYTQRSRGGLLQYTLSGGGVHVDASRSLSLGANVLHRDGLYDGTLTTLRSIVTPFEGASADIECGLDSGGRPGDPACALEFGFRSPRMTARGRFFRAGEGYPGSSRDLEQGSVGIEWRLPSGWSFRGEIDGLERGGTTGVARRRRSSVAAVGYRRPIGRATLTGQVQATATTNDYRVGVSRVDRDQRTVRVSSAYQTPFISIRGSADFGHAESDHHAYAGAVNAQRIMVQVRPSVRIDAGVSMEHESGFATSAPASVDRWFSGIHASWHPAAATRVRGSFYRNLDDAGIRRVYTAYELRGDLALPWGHRVSAQARHSVDDGRHTVRYSDYRFSYSVPLAIPMPATSRASRYVSGRVYDMTTGSGIPGVLIQLGDRMTLTDDQGRYRLIASTDLTQHLHLDQRSIGVDRVSILETPHAISPSRTDVEVDLPVAYGVTLSGEVVRHVPAEISLPSADGRTGHLEPIHGVIIEARGADRVFRTRTNRAGHFLFENIPPGDYVVSVIRGGVPGTYRWKEDRLQITVADGVKRTVRFDMVPIRRTIRRIDGGAAQLVPGSAQ